MEVLDEVLFSKVKMIGELTHKLKRFGELEKELKIYEGREQPILSKIQKIKQDKDSLFKKMEDLIGQCGTY